jgi:hypothetical protein
MPDSPEDLLSYLIRLAFNGENLVDRLGQFVVLDGEEITR